MEKLMKELEELKLSRIAASRASQKESVSSLSSLIEMKVDEIVDKQKRIDLYIVTAMTSNSFVDYREACDDELDFEQYADQMYRIAEAVEAEREKRINALNK